MEPSFRPRTDSARPPLSALLSARDLARFALTQVCVLISGNVSVTPSGPVETLSAWSREARLHRPKGQAGSARSFRNPTRNPNVVIFREPHPGQNVMLHECLRQLLLSPDEFMRLLND